MSRMFYNAREFNENINTTKVTINGKPKKYWDTSKVKYMDEMFSGAIKFNNGNEPLNWELLALKGADGMFYNTPAFNQSLLGVEVSDEFEPWQAKNMLVIQKDNIDTSDDVGTSANANSSKLCNLDSYNESNKGNLCLKLTYPERFTDHMSPTTAMEYSDNEDFTDHMSPTTAMEYSDNEEFTDHMSSTSTGRKNLITQSITTAATDSPNNNTVLYIILGIVVALAVLYFFVLKK